MSNNGTVDVAVVTSHKMVSLTASDPEIQFLVKNYVCTWSCRFTVIGDVNGAGNVRRKHPRSPPRNVSGGIFVFIPVPTGEFLPPSPSSRIPTGGTCMILNVDGSSIGNPGVSGFRGLIRNSDDAWVQGFVGNMGFSNILHAELLAHHYAAIIYNIKDLLAKDWRVKVVHTLREGNTFADYLAKLGARNDEAYSSIAIPSNGMCLLLLADASGTIFSR
ncbi:hypothetical protein TSUD_95790 [Trifolium subterraneum]|uniref:RNase H type-1 domain-containing protein n=1 Tax=Trifolium subterraneum TaxID=3900 RepID=A0A2Z6PLG2_TRISU|nr:hypothetical protein TSUD_95790 [Trifolium subterraneum]